MADFVPVNIHTVEQRRDALFATILQPRIGQAVAIDSLASSLLTHLPGGVHYDTVFESVRYLAGVTITEIEAMRLAWRLAGNLQRLREGIAVPPWSSQTQDEWVPLQIIKYVPDVNSRKKHGFTVTFRVLAGTPAPMKITTFWGTPACKFVASQIGFSRPWGKYPFSRTAELVGLRLYGLIDAAKSRTKPTFHDIQCSASMQKWNRDNVLKLRFRVGQECPNRYTHPCINCAIGTDRCCAATHPATYTIGSCVRCGKADALFDPDDTTTTYCIACGRADRIARRSAN